MVSEFGRVCVRRKLRVNMNKSKVLGLVLQRQVSLGESLNGENVKEVRCFRYLEIDLAANGTMEVEESHRMGKEVKVL